MRLRGSIPRSIPRAFIAMIACLGLMVTLAVFNPALAAPAAEDVARVNIGPVQAALIALFYYLANSPWLAGLGFVATYRPLIAGTIVGFILGDPLKGAEIGGAINVLYLGFISAGGSVPSDPSLAGYVGTAIAMSTNLPIDQAVKTGLVLAVPIGLVGTVIFALRMTVDSVFVHWADAFAEKGNIRGVAFANIVPSNVFLFIISFVPVFVFTVSSASWVQSVLNALSSTTIFGRPYSILGALFTAGGVLAAVGIAMNLRFLFKGALVPYYFLGFVLGLFALPATLNVTVGQGASAQTGTATYTSPVNIVVVAVIGVSLAVIHVALTRRRAPIAGASTDAGMGAPAVATATRSGVLTRADVFKSWLIWLFFSHSNYNYERLQATGFAHAMTPIIRKLYHTPEEVQSALQRHLAFFNTEPNWGGVIHGMTIAMEEERASGVEITDDAINSVKTGLMGPLAGIGDTIDQGTLMPIFLAVGISIAQQGSLLGPAIYMLAMIALYWGIGWYIYYQGYVRGRTAITNFLQSGVLQDVITGASVLGLIVLGALTVQFVNLQTKLVISAGGSTISLQSVFDQFMPHLLPLAVTVLFWYLLQRRRVHPLWLIFGTVVVILVGSYPFFGTFGFF